MRRGLLLRRSRYRRRGTSASASVVDPRLRLCELEMQSDTTTCGQGHESLENENCVPKGVVEPHWGGSEEAPSRFELLYEALQASA